jgi:hypothetical protein
MICFVPIVGIFHQQNLLSSPVVTQLRAFIDPGIVLTIAKDQNKYVINLLAYSAPK